MTDYGSAPRFLSFFKIKNLNACKEKRDMQLKAVLGTFQLPQSYHITATVTVDISMRWLIVSY